MLKKILFALYILVMVCMGAATIVEKYRGTDFVSSYIYGAWWFSALWAVLAAIAIVYFLQRKVRRASAVALHLSFVVILVGAFLTHVSSTQGVVHLRKGASTDSYLVNLGDKGVDERRLPFKMQLDDFNVKYHEGTQAVADYESQLTVIDGNDNTKGMVSMNNILSYGGYRFYQSSYDQDLRGSILSINSDPWGIPVTYTGYALLFISLVWMLFDPKGAYRKLLRSDLLKKGTLLVALLTSFGSVNAAPALPKETAEKFGELNILYNDRICPLQTFAIDFTKKLCGSASYEGYTPEQVLTGFIFWGDEWSAEKILKVKGADLRETLQLDKYVSVNTFFNRDMGGYIIGPYVQEYYQGNQDGFHKQVADVDDRLQLVMELRRGSLLKVFPVTLNGVTTWYAPTDKVDSTKVSTEQRTFIGNVFILMYQDVKDGNYANVNAVLDKIIKYQQKNGGDSLPTDTQVKAERIYNNVSFATILFMLNLTIGILTLFIYRKKGKPIEILSKVVMLLSFLALTLCLALRWIVRGTVPMSNGYETMLTMAWIVMLASLVICRKMKVILTFGFLMSGFMLLVSHINQMDPQISHIMPVLNSPLLSAHVSVIMMSFALLSLTFLCALTAIVLHFLGKRDSEQPLMLLSQLFLYPALAALGIGIFVGAIWANVSWGNYWGWDPKEVWALVTFMVYAVAVHRLSIPSMQRPMVYHTYMLVAFLSIVMTYFGVNFFLGGMHSYA